MYVRVVLRTFIFSCDINVVIACFDIESCVPILALTVLHFELLSGQLRRYKINYDLVKIFKLDLEEDPFDPLSQMLQLMEHFFTLVKVLPQTQAISE